MPKVVLLCDRIAAGKSVCHGTVAREGLSLLSMDEAMLGLYGERVYEIQTVAIRGAAKGGGTPAFGAARWKGTPRGAAVLLGTADASEGSLRLYASCGFRFGRALPGFFAERYELPDSGGGKRCGGGIVLRADGDPEGRGRAG